MDKTWDISAKDRYSCQRSRSDGRKRKELRTEYPEDIHDCKGFLGSGSRSVENSTNSGCNHELFGAILACVIKGCRRGIDFFVLSEFRARAVVVIFSFKMLKTRSRNFEVARRAKKCD